MDKRNIFFLSLLAICIVSLMVFLGFLAVDFAVNLGMSK